MVVISNPAFAIHQVYLAIGLVSSGVTVFLISFVDKDSLLRILRPRKICLPCTVEYIIPSHHPISLRSGSTLKSLVKALLLPVSSVIYLIRAKAFIRRLLAYIAYNNIEAVFLPELSPAYYASEVVYAAMRLSALLLTCPLDRDSPDSYAFIYKSSPDHVISGLRLLIARLCFPNWIHQYSGTFLIRIPLHEIFLHSLLGISSPMPWHVCGFKEHYTIFQSQKQARFYNDLGVLSAKAVVAGSVALDIIATQASVHYRT